MSLRVVGPDDEPVVEVPTSIAAAADAGRRQFLVAMRARISTTLDDPDTSPRDLAALMRRASEIDKEIRSLDAADKQEAHRNANGKRERRTYDSSAI